MFVDIDSLLRPVYGTEAGRLVRACQDRRPGAAAPGSVPADHHALRPRAPPVIAEAWLRGASRLRARRRPPAQAGHHHRPRAAGRHVMPRGDSAFGTKKVIAACLDEQVEFSLSLSRNSRITKAIEAIDDDAFTPVHYPGAVEDPDTGALISDAEVAETPYTLPAGPWPRHRPAGGAPGQRRPLPRGVVPGVAVSPVCDQLRFAHHRGRHHPPPSTPSSRPPSPI